MPFCILEFVEVLLEAVLKVSEVPEVMRCVILCMLEVMRRVRCMLEAVGGGLCSLEAL